MAKLIKAATARKRAQSVDRVGQILDDIASNISASSSFGNYVTYAGVGNDYVAEIVEHLQNAGYRVTEEPSWQPVENAPTKKSLFSRLFGDDGENPDVYLGYNPSFANLVISWAPDEEVQAA